MNNSKRVRRIYSLKYEVSSIIRKNLYKKIFFGTLLAVCTLFLPYFFVTLYNDREESDINKVKVTDSNIMIEVADLSDNGKKNCIAIDEYVKGALSCELNKIRAEFEVSDETAKVLAVIIRTHVYKIEENVEENIIAEEKCGYEYTSDYDKQADMAVDATDNIIIEYNGKAVDCFYCMSSGGMTRDGAADLEGEDYAYLKSVTVREDYNAPEFLTLCYYKNDEFREIINREFEISLNDNYTAADFDITDTYSAGYIRNVMIKTADTDDKANMSNKESDKRYKTVSGEQFAKTFDLPSQCFYIEDFNGGIRIVSKGRGHGFGMSLYGAEMMSRDNKTYEEIINYFYQSIVFVTL